jgi:hypothetical protein
MAKKRESQARGEQSLRRISAERNIEAWPIWQPADSRAGMKVRRYERESKLPDGSRVTATVDVGFSHLGVLTTEDQKVFYALIRMWEEDGRPDTLRFSLRGLARTLKKPWGAKVSKALTHSLRRLANTPLSWWNAYYDSQTQRRLKVLEEVKILSHLKIAETHDERERITTRDCEVRFHDMLLANLRGFHTKPVVFETVIKFESGVALMLYRHLDLMLADKDRYVRRTRELFEDIGLDGADYRKLSRRKRPLERAFKELNGAPLSSGRLRIGGIEPTRDGQDANASFLKTAEPALLVPAAEARGPSLDASGAAGQQRLAPVGQENAGARCSEDAVEAAELVRYFHWLCHGVENCTPQPKELAHAQSILKSHDADAARHFVEFAVTSARAGGYSPDTFGGIVQYLDRALAAHRQRPVPPADPVPAACGLRGGRKFPRIVTRDGREDVIGCPHDPNKVSQWVRERGLTLIEQTD